MCLRQPEICTNCDSRRSYGAFLAFFVALAVRNSKRNPRNWVGRKPSCQNCHSRPLEVCFLLLFLFSSGVRVEGFVCALIYSDTTNGGVSAGGWPDPGGSRLPVYPVKLG